MEYRDHEKVSPNKRKGGLAGLEVLYQCNYFFKWNYQTYESF